MHKSRVNRKVNIMKRKLAAIKNGNLVTKKNEEISNNEYITLKEGLCLFKGREYATK